MSRVIFEQQIWAFLRVKVINDTISDDEVVASGVPPRYLFLYKNTFFSPRLDVLIFSVI